MMMRPPPFLSTAALVAAVFTAACSTGGDGRSAEPSDEVSASVVPSVSGQGTEVPTDAPSPTASASTTDDPTDQASEPTDTDRARFAASYRPAGASDLEHVQVDVDGDGIDELVFAYVRGGEGVGHVDVADWDPEAGYHIVAGADGGVADRVGPVRIGDLNLDGTIEVALFQQRGSSGSSLTMWAFRNDRLAPQVARDGCWSGASTLGVIGATLEDRDGDGAFEIYATCDDSPLPASAWSTDGYRWSDNAWRYDPTL